MSHNNEKSSQSEIGLFPDDWQVSITKKCLSMPITDGPHETPTLYDDGIPFISAESISSGNGRIDFSRMRGYISEEYHQECCKKYKPQKNDVYIIKSGSTTGKVAIVKTEQVFNIWSPLAVLRAKQDIVPDYLFYAVQSNYYQEQIIQAWGMGTQQNIGMRTLEQLKIAYPEYDEQLSIATALSDMDALIEAKQALLEKKRAIKQGSMQELLTGKRRLPWFPVTPMKNTEIGEIPVDWEVKKLGEIGVVKMCKRIFKHETAAEGDIPFFKIGTFGQQPDAYISREKFNAYKGLYPYPQKGTPLISAAGTIGRVVVYDGQEAYYQDSNIVWLEHEQKDILNTFLRYYYGVISWVTETGSAITRLYNNNILSSQVALPTLEEQSAIASVLVDMDSEIESLEEELEKLVDIKQGMMQNLLTGRIRLV